MWKYFLFILGSLSAITYEAKDYNYLIDKMPKMDAALMDIHFKLYKGYLAQVNLLNTLLQQEENTKEKSFTYQAIKRRYGWEYDGMVLHELYFDNLGGDGKFDANSFIGKKIQNQFGSYDGWMRDFKATALTRGIGWVILCWDPKTDLLFNAWIIEHDTGFLAKCIPLLVIDLWEHAYLCQFKLDRSKYMEIMFEYIDWKVVESRGDNQALTSATNFPKRIEK